MMGKEKSPSFAFLLPTRPCEPLVGGSQRKTTEEESASILKGLIEFDPRAKNEIVINFIFLCGAREGR